MVAWHWIKSDPYTLNMWVSNRVSAIQLISDPSSWYHCPGTSNTADILSRGCLVDQLISTNYWLNGPCWLYKELDVNNIPKNTLDDEGEKMSENVTFLCLNNIELNLNFSAYSKFENILHIMSYILRFIYNCRHPYDKVTGPFSLYELQQAELRIIC